MRPSLLSSNCRYSASPERFRSNQATWSLLGLLGALIALVGVLSTPVRAQEWLWAASGGGASESFEAGYAAAMDSAGNVYVTGVFRETASFGSESLVSAGEGDVFVVKYSPIGQVSWARRAGGTANDEGLAITVDQLGGVIVVGNFVNSATFGSTTLEGNSSTSGFVVKYTSSGTLQWAKAIVGSNGNTTASGVAVASDAAIYVSGQFSGTTNFGTQIYTTPSGAQNAYLARFNNLGAGSWVRTAETSSLSTATAVSVGADDSVAFIGSFFGSASVVGTTLSSPASRDVLVARFESNGNLIFAKQFGSAGSEEGTAIALDASGNTYIAGVFSGSTTTIGTTTLNSLGNADAFLARLNPTGSVAWAKSGGGSSVDQPYSLAIDGAGRIAVAGRFSLGSTFDAMTVPSGRTPLLFTFTSGGIATSSVSLLATRSTISYGVAANSFGIAITGQFADPSLAFGTEKLSASAGASDAFTGFLVSGPGTTPPSITSSLVAQGTTEDFFEYTITADNNPTSFDATGLPGGLTFDPLTGVIAGVPTEAGEFVVTISASNAGGTSIATLLLSIITVQPLRLVNVSARGFVAGTQGNARNTFGGFIVKDGAARVFVQGAGPRLRPNPGVGLFDFAVPDYLTTPRLDVWQGNTSARVLIAANERWGTQTLSNISPLPSAGFIEGVRMAVGGYDYESGSADSAALINVAPGAYSMEFSSASAATGSGVLGFWLDPSGPADGSFANVSARGVVTPGDAGQLTAGTVISGSASKRARIVAIALGPWLSANAGLSGALATPTLRVRSLVGVLAATNTGWTTATAPAAIQTALNDVGSGITLSNSLADSAVVVDLAPGAYTFEVSTPTGSGISLVGLWLVGEVDAP